MELCVSIQDSQKLPVIFIIKETLRRASKGYISLIKIALPLIVTFSLLALCMFFLQSDMDANPDNYFGLFLFVFMIVMILILNAVVNCHRFFLLGPDEVRKMKFFHFSGNELSFFGWFVLIGIFSAIVSAFFTAFIAPFLGSIAPIFFESEDTRLAMLKMQLFAAVIQLPSTYLFAHLSMLLPSSAVGRRDVSVRWAWNLVKGNTLRMMVIVGVLPFLISMLISFLPSGDVFGIISVLLSLFAAAITIGFLSLSYEFLNNTSLERDGLEPSEEF
jgi:hypothetical protein